jgi:2-dehydro-3-deoxyphosphogalactonate aldolase
MKLADALAECPVVAILRGVKPAEVVAHVEALYAAGIRAVEVPLNSPEPLTSLRRIVAGFGGRMIVGAGTVLAADRVDAVADAGGRLIVSPNVDPAVIRRAVGLGLECAPGFATASEAFAAYRAGARHLKLFPAVTYGPSHLRQLKAVLPPEAVVWAVGGVGPDQVEAWWAAGARAFGLGGELYRAGQSIIDTSDKAALVMTSLQSLLPSAT